MILDEATAEAGSAGARQLERAARAALARRTSVVVAHRLTQARECDEIALMAHGRIVERGTHDELVAAGGAYAAALGGVERLIAAGILQSDRLRARGR